MEFELKHRHVSKGIPIMYPFGNKEGYYWIKEILDDDWFVAHYSPANGGEWCYPGLDDPISVREGRTIIIGSRLNPPENYEGLQVRPDLHEELRNTPEEQRRIQNLQETRKELKRISGDLADLLKS